MKASLIALLMVASLAFGEDGTTDRKILALIEKLAISDQPASREPFVTYDNPRNAELVRQVHATASGIEKFGSAAFPHLMARLDDPRQSVPFRRVVPSTVGDACLWIIMRQVYSLPEGYEQTASLYRRGADGKLHEQPVWSKQIYDEVGPRKWLTDRKGASLHDLQIEALEWVLETQKGIGTNTKEERDEFIAPLEVHLKKLAGKEPTGVTNGAELERTNLMAYADEQRRVVAVRTVADWGKRRAAVLEAMQKVMGPLPGNTKRCALDVKVEEEMDRGTYVLRKIAYSSEPDGRVPAYLLIPKAALAGRMSPAVLGLHQTHRLGNKVVVGLADSPDDAYGVALAERGFVVLAPPYPLLADYNPDLKHLGYQSGTMKAIWDNIRGLDLLASLPFVKTNGFAAIGHSLGGHNSVYTAVFDDRIKVVVTSCGLDSYRDYMDGNIKGWTSTRYMPKLLEYPLAEIPFDFHEMIGALAPRACFISAPIGDTNFKWKSVDAVAAAAWPVYELYGAREKLIVKHPDCPHRFPPEMREEAYRLIKQTLPP